MSRLCAFGHRVRLAPECAAAAVGDLVPGFQLTHNMVVYILVGYGYQCRCGISTGKMLPDSSSWRAGKIVSGAYRIVIIGIGGAAQTLLHPEQW